MIGEVYGCWVCVRCVPQTQAAWRQQVRRPLHATTCTPPRSGFDLIVAFRCAETAQALIYDLRRVARVPREAESSEFVSAHGLNLLNRQARPDLARKRGKRFPRDSCDAASRSPRTRRLYQPVTATHFKD